jgi:hypothetical protein
LVLDQKETDACEEVLRRRRTEESCEEKKRFQIILRLHSLTDEVQEKKKE